MKYLIDTNIYLWWLNNDPRLSNQIRNLLLDKDTIVSVSVISFWEISIKNRNKKLRLKAEFKKLFDYLPFNLLDVNINHILSYHKLPILHKDPFDRMLIAQAIAERCTIITTDAKIKKYKIPIL